MNNPTPRDSAQLPPLPAKPKREDRPALNRIPYEVFTSAQLDAYAEAYAREALRAQAESSPAAAVDAVPLVHAGCLPTMNQDEYPGLDAWWVQLWDGRGNFAKVVARVYGDSPESAMQRAEAFCAALQASRQPHAQQGGGEQLEIAINMLAEWCVAVDVNGTGWDDWDEHYKDARFRPGPLRELLDKEIAAVRATKEQRS